MTNSSEKTSQLKVSDVVMQAISDAGVNTVFGIAGGASLHLLDSVISNSKLTLVTTHHEQAAAMAADSYSRVSGNLGVAIATSGPGATNLITGIAGCYYDSIPVVFITGQVSTTRQRGLTGSRQIGFQETPISKMVEPIVKFATQVNDPRKVREEIERCIYLAQEGRPGPVLIDIPDDIQRMYVMEGDLTQFYPPSDSRLKTSLPLSTLGELVRQSKRPIVVCGAGINLANRRDEVIEFLSFLRWPVLLTWGISDLLGEDFPWRVGTFGTHGSRIGNLTAQNADLIISIGARLDTKATGSPVSEFAQGAKIVMFDVDISELEKFSSFGKEIDLQICLDLRDKAFLSSLKLIMDNSPNTVEWVEFVDKSKKNLRESRSDLRPAVVEPYRFIETLSKCLPFKSRIFIDTGCAIAWAMEAWENKNGHRLYHDFNNTAMGWALPALIGSLAENASVPSFAIIGDGSLMMSLQELATLKSLPNNSCIFLLNNSGYSMIKQTQDQWFDGDYFASDADSNMIFPNFSLLAAAFDLNYALIDTENGLDSQIKKILSNLGPTLCEVTISPSERVVPIVKFGSKIYEMEPPLMNQNIQDFLL
jgi:acetolactate synthase-1/2/3 large subunit